MMRYLIFIVFSTLLNVVVFAQGVTAFHDVQPAGENSYTIKTTVSGLQGADIARITYYIDNTHTYNASPNNAFFSDRNDKFVKFYIMAIPNSGEITVELGVTLVGSGEFAFPVEFQYSKNEEKKSINFPQINIAGEAMAAVEETPSIEEVEKEEVVIEESNEESLEEKIKAEEQEQLAKEQEEAEAAAKKEAEEKALAEKLAEEQRAKEEEEAAKKAKAEEEKRLAEEKAKAEKLVAEQKAKEEAEALAKAEEAKRIAEEKATESTEEVVVEETTEVTEEEAQPKVVTPPTSTSESSAQYSIQILSLSKFSQSRLDNYIKQHNLDKDKVVKREVGEWTKISYGKLNSKDEAREMIQRLRRNHNITEGFLVTLP